MNEPLTEDKMRCFQMEQFTTEHKDRDCSGFQIEAVASAVQGLKEDIENYQEKTRFYNGQRSITKTRALMLIEKWFPAVTK